MSSNTTINYKVVRFENEHIGPNWEAFLAANLSLADVPLEKHYKIKSSVFPRDSVLARADG